MVAFLKTHDDEELWKQLVQQCATDQEFLLSLLQDLSACVKPFDLLRISSDLDHLVTSILSGVFRLRPIPLSIITLVCANSEILSVCALPNGLGANYD